MVGDIVNFTFKSKRKCFLFALRATTVYVIFGRILFIITGKL